MISLNNVTVSYGSFTLLDDVSVHISESDKIGLVGKNGAGKSTLMKLITGEQSPTSGHIDMPADLRIGYLPQIMEHHRGWNGSMGNWGSGRTMNHRNTPASSTD